MRTDPIEEWRRLTEHYRALTDDQLYELAAECADLTEAAQQILRGEMRSRGLSDLQARPEVLKDPERSTDEARDVNSSDPEREHDLPHEYTWKTLLRECNTSEEAWQVCELLRRAEIESWIDGPGVYSPHAALDLTYPRVLVAADELDRAREITSMPIPQDIVNASKETVPEFEVPSCPGCGAADPLLEDVDPVNAWRCEFCGRRWADGNGAPNPQS